MKTIKTVIALVLFSIIAQSLISCVGHDRDTQRRIKAYKERRAASLQDSSNTPTVLENTSHNLFKCIVQAGNNKYILEDPSLRAYSINDTIHIFSGNGNTWIIDHKPLHDFYTVESDPNHYTATNLIYKKAVIRTFLYARQN